MRKSYGMRIAKLARSRKIIAQLQSLVLPASLTGASMLGHLNQYYSVLNNQWLSQTVFLTSGLACGSYFYNHSFRFITTSTVLALALMIGNSIIKNVFTGEFSAFYASTRFYIFSI